MNPKWIGTVIILLGCGGLGFRMAASHRQQVRELRQLLSALDVLEWELRYRLAPLPELCQLVSESVKGTIGSLFRALQKELERQIAPDAGCCMNAAVSDSLLSPIAKQQLRNLGRTLGRFDLEGQREGIAAVRQEIILALDKLTKDQEVRLRSYQTLGLCAGAALAILLL